MNIKFILYVLVIFFLIATAVYSLASDVQQPMFINFTPRDKPSPHDWIKENQIAVLNDRVIIQIQDPEWAAFTDTNSMDPVIDYGANAIQIIPKAEEDIHVGDIVSYQETNSGNIIIHRVIEINEDEKGVYYVVKGDNNTEPDPNKLRFSQIRRVLVAIIY